MLITTVRNSAVHAILSFKTDWRTFPVLQLELQQILYIVFIHSYLYLVKNDASSEATQLFSRHSHRFTSLGGQSFKIRMQVGNPSNIMCTFPHAYIHQY